MKDDQKMKHKKYKQQTTHQEQPDQMSPSNQSDWMQPADQNPTMGKSFWKDRFVPFWMKNKKRNLKILISVLAILIVAVVVVALLYVNNLLNLIGPEDPKIQITALKIKFMMRRISRKSTALRMRIPSKIS